MKWNATIIVAFFQSTRTDQNSSSKVLQNIIAPNCTIWSSELNQKSFSCFPHVTYYTGRDQRVPPFNFSALPDFFSEKIYPKGSPLQFFCCFATEWMLKNSKGSPFQFFGFVRLFSIFFLFSPKGPPFNFFDISQQIGCLKIPKGPPFQFFGIVRLFRKFVFSPKGPPAAATKMLTISEVSPF